MAGLPVAGAMPAGARAPGCTHFVPIDDASHVAKDGTITAPADYCETRDPMNSVPRRTTVK